MVLCDVCKSIKSEFDLYFRKVEFKTSEKLWRLLEELNDINKGKPQSLRFDIFNKPCIISDIVGNKIIGKIC